MNTQSHHALLDRGNELHEARQYRAALPWLDRALAVAPDCPAALYSRASTLHMLERNTEAEPLLRELISATHQELRRRCPESMPRSVQLDAHYLLFLVMIYGRGFSEEAFAFARKHLRMRRRGLHSVFSARAVRSDILAKGRDWNLGIDPRG